MDCKKSGAVFAGTGNAKFSCCGRKLEPLKAQKSDIENTFNIYSALSCDNISKLEFNEVT